MTKFGALLGTCLALPLATFVSPARAQQVVYVPPGATVVILPGPAAMVPQGMPDGATVSTAPVARLIAEQETAMRQMVADMNQMFPPMPDPEQLLRAAMPGGVLAGGHGVCMQSMRIVDRGDGTRPLVSVSQSGDACGPLARSQPQQVTAPQPAPMLPPAPIRRAPRVLKVANPAHTVLAQNLPPRN